SDRPGAVAVVVEELGALAGFLRLAGEHSVPGVLAVEVAAQLDPDLVQRAGLEGQALSQVLPAGAQGQRERGQTGLVHLKVIDELPGTRTKPFLVAGRQQDRVRGTGLRGWLTADWVGGAPRSAERRVG